MNVTNAELKIKHKGRYFVHVGSLDPCLISTSPAHTRHGWVVLHPSVTQWCRKRLPNQDILRHAPAGQKPQLYVAERALPILKPYIAQRRASAEHRKVMSFAAQRLCGTNQDVVTAGGGTKPTVRVVPKDGRWWVKVVDLGPHMHRTGPAFAGKSTCLSPVAKRWITNNLPSEDVVLLRSGNKHIPEKRGPKASLSIHVDVVHLGKLLAYAESRRANAAHRAALSYAHVQLNQETQ